MSIDGDSPISPVFEKYVLFTRLTSGCRYFTDYLHVFTRVNAETTGPVVTFALPATTRIMTVELSARDELWSDMQSGNKQLALRVHELGKAYRLPPGGTHAVRQYRTIREDFMRLIRLLFNRERNPTSGSLFSSPPLIWALRDVSFEVERGAALGIIGANGAGKSTLLKILSRITRPTTGSADVYGRVGSLLEVGTGFHHELTGRENIFLAGAVLGMHRAEIRRRFDSIVAFAETETYLDVPVKRYSTGMYMRLAFAVAAHLETEILLVDEVLAVGDAAFQQKCLGKMGDVAEAGRTVLFVSHNMAAISALCPRTIQLAGGRVVADGRTPGVIRQYLADDSQPGRVDLTQWAGERRGAGPHRLRAVYARRLDGTVTSVYRHGETLIVGLTLGGKVGLAAKVVVTFKNTLGYKVVQLISTDVTGELFLPDAETHVEIQLDVPFNDGVFFISVWYGDILGNQFDYVGSCLSITVDASQTVRGGRNDGVVLVPSQWRVIGG